MNKLWLPLLALFFCCFAPVQAYAMSEEEKITALIASVKDTPEGTQFVRNGKAYSVTEAIDHLNYKYARAKSKVKTAEDFIKYVASKSSMSGEDYLIRYPDGKTATAEAFFAERLRKLKSEK
ncbi:MAG: DUF5329 domain-containing protein [Betaproteobacteria bacterium]|nr:DUF5329 domain-containing protein [Betaproteobacteria bacterium]